MLAGARPWDVDERADRAAPWIVAALIFACLYTLARLRDYTFLSGYDTAYFHQAAWLITHHKPVFVTSRGLYLLGDHASPIFWPMAWITFLLPAVPTLLAIQAGALALGAVPLYRVARRVAGLAALPALVLIVAYGLFPAMNNVNVADFHPEVVAVPALLGATLYALSRRWLPYALCMGIVLLCKEDLALVVAAFGVFLWFEGERRVALLTLAVGLVWFAVDVRVIQSHFAAGFVQSVFLERYGHGLGSIAKTMLLHPNRVLGDLVTGENLRFVIGLMAPLLFLPLMAPRYLIPALPTQLLLLVSDRAAAHTINDQYTVAIIGFCFVATAMVLARIGQRPPRAVLGGVLVASLLFNASLSLSGLTARPWTWRHRDAVDRARIAGARLIPKRASVAASDRLRPLIAARTNLYNFPSPFLEYDGRNDPVPLARRVAETRYLFVDTEDAAQWQPDRQAGLVQVVPQYGFRKIFDREGIEVYAR